MKADGCELCEAAKMTPWHHEDAICWVADCEACDVPIVVWNEHGAEPPGVQRGRSRRPEGDVAEMPCRVRGVQERDEITPAARTQRVERRPLELRRAHRIAHPT